MKKLLAILLAGLMMLSFAACGTNDNPSGSENTPGTSQSGENNDKPVEAGEMLSIKLGASIPKPDIDYTIAYDDSSSFKIDWNWETITLDQVRHYAKRMEAAGFTCTDENDNEEMGFYIWEGEKDNLIVEIDKKKVWIEIDETKDSGSNSQESSWNDPKYTAYTSGLEEPDFSYEFKGVLMDQLTINAEATLDEIEEWKQFLLDSGFEEYREGEQWGIKNATHNIQMNGYVDGVAYIYIGLVG